MEIKEKEKIGISIIVPCYNISEYSDRLSNCIEKQLHSDDYKSMEFILINDGSKDDTLKQIQLIQEKYPFQVNVIDQPNMGVSAARNAGIARARGEYIGFLDSDDVLKDGAVSSLLKMVAGNDVDVLIYGFESVSDVCQISHKSSSVSNQIIYQGDLREYYLKFTPIVVWRMLYRSSFIKDNRIQFSPITIGEDTLFNFEVFMLGGRVKHIDSVLCYHIDRENSLTTCVDSVYVHRIIASVLKIQEVYNNYILSHELSTAIVSRINEHRRRQICFVYTKLIASTECFKYQEIKNLRFLLERNGAFPIVAVSRHEHFINFCFKNPLLIICLYYLRAVKKNLSSKKG